MICPSCGGTIPGEPDDGIPADFICSYCEDEEDNPPVRVGGLEEREDSPCIGPECVNPDPDHGYSECSTVEQHEAYEAELDEQRGDA